MLCCPISVLCLSVSIVHCIAIVSFQIFLVPPGSISFQELSSSAVEYVFSKVLSLLYQEYINPSGGVSVLWIACILLIQSISCLFIFILTLSCCCRCCLGTFCVIIILCMAFYNNLSNTWRGVSLLRRRENNRSLNHSCHDCVVECHPVSKQTRDCHVRNACTFQPGAIPARVSIPVQGLICQGCMILILATAC